MAAIPPLEAISIFYKIVANIDAYPIVIDFNRIKSDEDFFETVDAIMLAYSAVEFFDVSEERVNAFKALVQKNGKGKKYAFINGGRKIAIDQCIAKKPECLFSANGLYAAILRTALDTQTCEDLDPIVDFVKEQPHCEKIWVKTFSRIQEIAANYIFEKQINNDFYEACKSSREVKHKYQDYLLFGKNAWVKEYPNNYMP